MRIVLCWTASNSCWCLQTSATRLGYPWWVMRNIDRCGPAAEYNLVVQGTDSVASQSALWHPAELNSVLSEFWSARGSSGGGWPSFIHLSGDIYCSLVCDTWGKLGPSLRWSSKKSRSGGDSLLNCCVISTIIRLFSVHLMKFFAMSSIWLCIMEASSWRRAQTFCGSSICTNKAGRDTLRNVEPKPFVERFVSPLSSLVILLP